MKTLFVHAYSGVAGDMLLGALLDLGVDQKQLVAELNKLPLEGYELSSEKVIKNGVTGTKAHVKIDEGHHHRGLTTIKEIINGSQLSEWVKEQSIAIFTNLAQAEAKIHGSTLDEVHFHEVGAIDAIVDIVGVCIGLELLGKPQVFASPLHVGTGFVKAAHGVIPVPAPATLEIIAQRRAPTYSRGIEAELVTPTGAAIVTTIAEEFGPQPIMETVAIGYGAGTRELQIPNFVRLQLGEQKKNNFQKSRQRSHGHAHTGEHQATSHEQGHEHGHHHHHGDQH